MIVVLDTDVLYAGLYSASGASRRALHALWPPSAHRWLLSVPLMLEYEAVLTRESFLKKAGLTQQDIGVFLDAVAGITTHVTMHYHWRPLLVDPNDDHVAETAVNGSADAVITFNKKDFVPLQTMFNVTLFTPAEWLERISQ